MWITHDQTLDDLNVASNNLTIACLYFTNIDFGDAIIQSLQDYSGRSFDKIVLHSCRGKLDAVISFFLRGTRIKEFVINETHLGSTSVLALGESLCAAKALKCLHLPGIDSSLDSSSHSVEALKYGLMQCPSLEHLVCKYASASFDNACTAVLDAFLVETIPRIANLKRLEIWSYKQQDRSLTTLLRSIQIHPSLSHLRISVQTLEPSILGSIDLLSRCSQSKLQELNLSIHSSCDRLHKLPSSCRFVYTIDPVVSNDNMDYLGKALVDNPKIVSLDLSHKGLKDEGVVALASWLGKIKYLKRLDIQGNPFQTTGEHALLSAMESNLSIEDIDLPYGCACADYIHHYADLNKGGRKLLTNETFPLSLWPLVLEKAANAEFKPRGSDDDMNARRANVVYNLLHGLAGFQISCYK
jgi:hypothetical protein